MMQGWDSSTFTRISVEQKLISVVDDDHFRGKKVDEKRNQKIPKQSESVFGLSAFCRILKLLPDVHARYIVVLAFKNGHASGKSYNETGVKNGWRWQWA